MARGEPNDLQQTMPLVSVTRGGHVPRLMRGTASRWRTLVLLSEALLLVGAVFLAVYLRFITHPDPLQTYATISVQLARSTTFTVMIVLTFAIEIGQGVSGTGAMEMEDIVAGMAGFLAVFLVFALLRAIWRAIWGKN